VKLEDCWKVWQDFWFKPQSPLPVAVFRIAFGCSFLTGVLTQYGHDFLVFFGQNPVLSRANFIAYWQFKDLLINIFDFVPRTNQWHLAVFAAMGITSVMMIFGLFTRFSCFMTFIFFASVSNQYPFLCNAGDDMQRLVLFLLPFTRAGDALSIDSILGKPREKWYRAFFMPPLAAPWAQRMLQLQISLAYVSTGLLKLNSDVWFYGNGLNYGSRLADFSKFAIPHLLDHRFTLYFLNWGTIALELVLGTLIWISEFTNWLILIGVAFHLGIDWTMNIPIFEFCFITMYILFIKPEDLYKVFRWFNSLYRYLNLKLKKMGGSEKVWRSHESS